MTRVLAAALAILSLGSVAAVATAPASGPPPSPAEPCCSVVALDAQTRSVTAIDRKSAKMFSFTVTNPATFTRIRLADPFDAAVATLKKGMTFSADLGRVRAGSEPCCSMTTDVGGAGQALGVRAHDAQGVLVVLLELKRTAGNTVTARWEDLNSSDQPLQFEQEGCTGMGCTYPITEHVSFLDGATRTKFEVLRDSENKVMAQRYEASKLAVGAHQILSTWAKFNAPPVTSSRVTFMIPGVSDPFEDVPISAAAVAAPIKTR